jgi:hypothetical protein
VPFTPSHLAAALPFLRTPLVPAAVALGTMAPDFPYYVPRHVGIPRDLTHSLLGLVTIDPAMTLVAVAAWWFLLREPIVELLPASLRERLPPRRPSAWRQGRASTLVAVLLLVLSALVGNATHLLWDSFTHPGWMVDHLPLLRRQVGPLSVDKWLQHASTVFGLVALAVWAVLRLRRVPRDTARPTRWTRRERAVAAAAIVVAALVPSGAWWIHGLVTGSRPLDPVLLFPVAVLLVAAGTLAVVLCAIVWQLLRRRA